VERVSLIDLITLFDYTAKRLNKVLENLVIFPERMLKNIYVTKGAIFSQRVMSALIEKGLSREQAYDFVQPLAMNAVQGGNDLLWALLENEDIKKYMNREEIQACFSIDYYLKNMDVLFERVLNQ
jgi:adenylosuccinate lyase